MTYLTTATGPNGQATPVAIFPDFEHLAQYLTTVGDGCGWRYAPDVSQRMLRTGDQKLADKAEKLLATMEAESLYSDNVATWGRSVSGAMPDVPAYLAGSPLNMRRRVAAQGLAPLTIVVETFMSGTIGDDDRTRRGVAILALVRKLAMTGHAVDLWLAHTSRPGETATCLVRVETRPLDMARAVWGMVASFERDGFKSASTEVLYSLRSYDHLTTAFGDMDFPNNPKKLTAYYSPILNVENALLAIPGLCGDQSEFTTDGATKRWLDRNYAIASELARQQLAA